MKNTVAQIFIIVILSACVLHPKKTDDFDPNEAIVLAIIKSKKRNSSNQENSEVILYPVEKQSELDGSHSNYTETTVAIIGSLYITALLGTYPSGSTDTTRKTDPIEYIVISNENIEYSVISYYTGFEVGECVKLFVSENSQKYPLRMTYTSGCNDR
jgi:hypothetical protein